MKSHPRMSELLVKTGAFRDLDLPVILTSGELGIYYINTEKLCQDGGEFEKYGNNSIEMINHAVRMTEKYATFNEVIEIIANKASTFLPRNKRVAISGGQRRDWLFSGPVAKKLQINHLSIYKEGKVSLVSPGSRQALEGHNEDLQDICVLHIADLLTEASSCYRVDEDEELGWIPEIRKRGGRIENLVAVVTRQQGGEQRLENAGVTPFSFVAIDPEFIRKHSKYSLRDIAYMNNPRLWSEEYLNKNGAVFLLEDFDPNGKKIDRAKKFLDRYNAFLKKQGRWEELDNAVHKKYNTHLSEILGEAA